MQFYFDVMVVNVVGCVSESFLALERQQQCACSSLRVS